MANHYLKTPLYVWPDPQYHKYKKKHPLSIKGFFLINTIIESKNLKPRAFTKGSILNLIKFNIYNINMLQHF